MAQLLHDWVTAHARTRPDATAVVCGATRLSYGQLDAKSNRLARVLREAGCRQGEPIAVLMPKSMMALVALLGIYKADGVYVPLDLASPSARLRKMIAACGITRMLAAGPVEPVLTELVEDPSVRLSIGWLEPDAPGGLTFDFRADDLSVYGSDPIETRNRSFHPANVLFASGSTGVPKGVILTHANLIHCVEWTTRHFRLTADDRISCHSPLHVDLSLLDIFSAAVAGAELHLVPPMSVLPHNLAEFIRASAITHWCSAPSVLSCLVQFDLLKSGSFPALKRVLWTDVLPTGTLMHWMTRLPHVRFTHLYGATETSIVTSAYTVPECPADSTGSIPIGTVCTGKDLLVLSPTMAPVPQGEIGDLYIGGAGVSRGYWGDIVQTNLSFVRHPRRPNERLYKTGDLARVEANGITHIVGRREGQIKTRGYRVELGEIETALKSIDTIKNSAIVALDRDGFDGALICCAYVPRGGDACSPVVLRRELSRLVPSYMLPVHWMASDTLPTNGSGMIDRLRLRGLFEERISMQEQRPVA